MKITVKSIRITCGYSIEKMAEKLEISPRTYAFYERHPYFIPVNVAVKISAIGNISLDYIFFD